MQSTIADLTPPIPNLFRVFATIPDPRTRCGRRYSVATLLTIAVAGIVSHYTSVLAIAEWAAALRGHARTRLGLSPTATPHQTTFARLFRRIDPAAVTIALTQAFDPRRPTVLPLRGQTGIALDGKTHRRRLALAPTNGSTIHMVSLVDHIRGIILAQQPVTAATGASESRVALPLVAQINWTGRVLTGDALHCQTVLCTAVLAAGGDYLLRVKANQPRLLQDIQWLFAEPDQLDDYRTAQVIQRGHGRHELRQIVVSSDLAEYSPWPALAQVFRITRTWWTADGTRHRAVRYGITSLPATVSSATQLMRLFQGHWTIENRVGDIMRVRTVANTLLGEWKRVDILCTVAEALAGAKLPEAYTFFVQARRLAESIPDERKRATALHIVVKSLVRGGYVTQACSLAEAIPAEDVRTSALQTVYNSIESHRFDQHLIRQSICRVWRQASTRDKLLTLLPIAVPLLAHTTMLGQDLLDSFAWVDAQIQDRRLTA